MPFISKIFSQRSALHIIYKVKSDNFNTTATVSKLTKTTLPINRTIYSSSNRFGSLTMPLLLLDDQVFDG